MISLDASFKDSKTCARNAITAWGRKGADFYLLDGMAFKAELPELIETFKLFLQKMADDTAKACRGGGKRIRSDSDA